MTKRWERELRRLDDVDAPTERIRAHAADRPTDPTHGDGLPPRRQRITAGVVAVVVFVAAGTFAWQAFRPGDDNADMIEPSPGTEVAISLVAEQSDGGSSPRASLQSGSDVSRGFSTSFSWQDGNSIMYADSVEPRFSPEEYVPIPLPASLVVNGDAAEAHLWLERPGAYPFDEVRYLGESQDQPFAFNESGRFILHVRASWPQGDVSFYFPIELVPQVVNPATLSFIAKDPPEGHLQYGGVGFQAGVRGEYQWCDGTDAACVAGVPEFPTFPPVSKFMEIPAGTLLMLEGTVPSIKGGFLTMDGEKASPTFEDPAHFGSIPTEPGKYALEVHVGLDGDDGAHGSATFWFGVEVPEADTLTQAADVLRVACSEEGTDVLTPVVAALPDGVHVIAEADRSTVSVEFRYLGEAQRSGAFGGDIRTEGPRPWPIAPGRSEVRCRDTSGPPAEFEVIDPNGYWLDGGLECSVGDPASAVASYDGGAAEYVNDSSAIRSLLLGLEEGDQIGLPAYRGVKDARLVIVRDDMVVGAVWVGSTDERDPRGEGLTRVVGEVCRSSGIDGNVPSNDPDEDGVALDCAASAQAAFVHEQRVVLQPALPSYIYVNVEGVQSSDSVTLETPSGDSGEGMWVIVRDGKRIASVQVPELDGVACRGSGIGGT